jgi:hypothetical protein
LNSRELRPNPDSKASPRSNYTGAAGEDCAHQEFAFCTPACTERYAGESPIGPVERKSPAWQKAQFHYRQGLAAAKRAGLPPEAICDAFGSYSNRCGPLGE